SVQPPPPAPPPPPPPPGPARESKEEMAEEKRAPEKESADVNLPAKTVRRVGSVKKKETPKAAVASRPAPAMKSSGAEIGVDGFGTIGQGAVAAGPVGPAPVGAAKTHKHKERPKGIQRPAPLEEESRDDVPAKNDDGAAAEAAAFAKLLPG